MTIAELNRRFNTADISKFAGEAVQKYEAEIVEANQDQLQDGELSNTQPIRPKYKSDWYARMKQTMNANPDYGTPDLKKEGGFYAGFKVFLQGRFQYRISSTDSKTSLLSDKYKPEIFGLNQRNTRDVGERYVQPDFIARLKTFLFRWVGAFPVRLKLN